MQMRRPGLAIDEVALGMGRQACDDRSRQGAFAHVGKRLIVDDIVGVAVAQAFEEIQAAHRGGGGEPSEVVVADHRPDLRQVIVGACARTPTARLICMIRSGFSAVLDGCVREAFQWDREAGACGNSICSIMREISATCARHRQTDSKRRFETVVAGT
jgi:hypothetical protein